MWTDAKVSTAKRMWDEGYSASQIGSEIGKTRNSVIGKLHRLNAPKRKAPTSPRAPERPRIKRKKVFVWKMRPAPEDLLPPTPIEELVLPLEPLLLSVLVCRDDQCHWPIGDPKLPGFGYCGHKTFGPLSYCEGHARIAYQPVQSRKGRQREAEHAAARYA